MAHIATSNPRNVLLALVAALMLTLPAAAEDIATVEIGADAVFVPQASGSLRLTVSGPADFSFDKTFGPGDAAVFSVIDEDGYSRADGLYTWELSLVAAEKVSRKVSRERGGLAPSLRPRAQSGAFTIAGGQLASPELPESSPEKAQVIATDLIVDGSACVGIDCASSESFGFDTFRLKENNLRLHFDDTSGSASFPKNDWRLVANDSSNGGAEYFAIEDATAGRQVFRVEAGAIANALYVDSEGDVGVGTSNPVVEAHLVDGNTPTLRLEQDGSSGFTSQSWDVAGNETNFFVRDVTNGSKLPFRIRPGAPDSSIDIAADGDVGMGTGSPAATLDIVADQTAMLRVENTAGANRIAVINGSGIEWRITNSASDTFRITEQTDTDVELELDASGNLTIKGGLITSSGGGACTGADPCDGVFHPDFELPSIEEHAAAMWENSFLPAVGPTLPNQPVNLTDKTTGMLNELEKAHIYIEQLHTSMKQMQQRLEALESEKAAE